MPDLILLGTIVPVAPDRTVFLVDRGHHACYAGSAALVALAERAPALAGAALAEGETGSLVAGKRADPVVLGEDPAAVGPTRIKDIPVVATLVGGVVAWGSLDGLPAAP